MWQYPDFFLTQNKIYRRRLILISDNTVSLILARIHSPYPLRGVLLFDGHRNVNDKQLHLHVLCLLFPHVLSTGSSLPKVSVIEVPLLWWGIGDTGD